MPQLFLCMVWITMISVPCARVFPEDRSAADVAEKVAAKYRSLETLSYQVVITFYAPEAPLRFRFEFLNTNRRQVRFNLYEPNGEVTRFISDGVHDYTIVEAETPRESREDHVVPRGFVRYTLGQLAKDIPEVGSVCLDPFPAESRIGLNSAYANYLAEMLTGRRRSKNDVVKDVVNLLERKVVGDVLCEVVELKQYDMTFNPERLARTHAFYIAAVGPEAGLLQKYVTRHGDGTLRSESVYSNYQLNAPVDPKLFRFVLAPWPAPETLERAEGEDDTTKVPDAP